MVPQLYPALLTTPELDAIRARRQDIDEHHANIRGLLLERHIARCRGDARCEAELDARIASLQGQS